MAKALPTEITTSCSPFAVLYRKTKVPPYTEKLVQVVVKDNKLKESDIILFDPLPERKRGGLLLKRSVNSVTSNGNYFVRVANNGDSPIWLNKSTKLFEVEPLEIRNFPTKRSKNNDREPLSVYEFELGHLNFVERNKIQDLILKFSDVFARDSYELEGTDLLEHEIHLTDEKPIRLRPYKVPHAMKPILEEQVFELLESGVIRKSSSSYGFPVVLIKKNDGSFRFCVDFRKLNDVTRKDNYPLPLIHQTLDLLHGAKYFSALDLTSGFHQIPIRESDRRKTAFICDQGLYEFNRIAFGLKNSRASFERAMDTIFQDLRDDAILVYVDDILCASSDLESHLAKLEIICQRLRTHGLKIKPNKCHSLGHEITYLGQTGWKWNQARSKKRGSSREIFPSQERQASAFFSWFM